MTTKFNKGILYIIGLFGFLFIACGLVSCAGSASSQSGFESKLRVAIQKSAKGEIQSFAMETITDFPWDGLYIFGPYTPANEIEKALGVAWPPARKCGIEMSDTFCLLVFKHKEKIIRYYEYSRSDGDWSALSSTTKISPNAAVFVAREQNGVIVIDMADKNQP